MNVLKIKNFLHAFAGWVLLLLGACSAGTGNEEQFFFAPKGLNQPTLQFVGEPKTSVTAGDAYQFKPQISNPENHTLHFSITNKPDWATFNETTGTLSGTPTGLDVGAYGDIVITAFSGTETVAISPFDLEVIAAVPVATSGAIELPARGETGVQLKTLRTSSMDEAFANTKYAPGWSVNAWGEPPVAEYFAQQETRPEYVYSGAGSQMFQIINKNNGEVQLVSRYSFVKDRTYRARLHLRADEPTDVQVFMRRDEAPWDAFATRTLTLDTVWQTVEIEGMYIGDVSGSLRVAIKGAAGTVWVDDVTLMEVVRNDMVPVSATPIPDTLFGMHVNKLGVHKNWPGLQTHIIRLWNTGTTWRDLEPTNGGWDFTVGSKGGRLDMYVDYAIQNNASVIYTMGQTPQWASTTPNIVGDYGAGATGAPKNMEDWRDYVRTLARRYAGKIRYWELWNEPDYAPTGAGGSKALVEMARIAREELLAADSSNKLLGPGFSAGQGMRGLEDFLVAGGGAYVDVIAFHWYYDASPESLGGKIDNVRTLMKTYGIGNKPLWNTEGAFSCDKNIMDCNIFTPTLAQLQSVNPRALFIMADRGVANFNYHNWESTPWGFGKLVEDDFITPTPAAITLATARTWVSGAKVVDGYRMGELVYMLKLDRSGEIVYVLWATKADTRVHLPTAWNVTRVQQVTGGIVPLPSNREWVLGLEPILLRP